MPASYLDKVMGSVADCLDAFSACLFVSGVSGSSLRLKAFHSLSDSVIPGAVIEEGQGFISWVMKNQKPIHVPRFNRDSRTLGFYRDDAGLKSLLAVPLPGKAGVISVDSRSRFAFLPKHERILRSLGEAVLELLDAEKSRALADFYSGIMKWQMTAFKSNGEAVRALLEVLGLDTVIVVRHLEDTSFYVVEDVVGRGRPGGRSGKGLYGKRIPLGQGLAGWVVKHRSGILLDRRRKGTEPGLLLFPGETLDPGPVALGVFCPSEKEGLDVSYCFLFSGSADTSFWPADVVNMLEFLLKGMLPWHLEP